MYCPKCQHTLRDEALFCDRCGHSVSFSSEILAQTVPASDPLIGHILDAKYELIEKLGEGGMGVVYRARRHIGDEVAIKILHQEYVTNESAVERFRREAFATAKLHHSNVVSIHDFCEPRDSGSKLYIVMELVEGKSLRDLLKDTGVLNPARAVMLIREICAGVGAAHRRNIIHRDLKPDNVIVIPPDEDRERETAKVVDFGIAKLRDLAGFNTLTQTGTVMGTPYYMSPEQCRGEQLDTRSDVYSLGAMFYEMLTGTPPFVAETYTGVITKHLYEEPPPIPANLNVSRTIEAVVRRALAKDPNLRQPDATVLSRELQDAERYRHEEESLASEMEQQRKEEVQRKAKAKANYRQYIELDATKPSEIPISPIINDKQSDHESASQSSSAYSQSFTLLNRDKASLSLWIWSILTAILLGITSFFIIYWPQVPEFNPMLEYEYDYNLKLVELRGPIYVISSVIALIGFIGTFMILKYKHRIN